MVLLLLALLTAPQETATEKRLAALVAQLGSDDLEAREKAQADLFALGPDIKPGIEKHLADASGETAKRLRAVLDRFESDRFFKGLVAPVVRITLDKKRRTPEEVFALIKEKTGWNIRAAAMSLREPIELGWTDAPALQVIDDVCRALGRGKVQLRVIAGDYGRDLHSMQFHGRTGRGGADERVVSIDGSKPPSAWVAYSNQFRAELQDIVITETRDFSGSKGNASIILQLTGQPGLTVQQVGVWIVDEIVDDKGRSLKSDAKPQRFGNEQSDSEPGESRDSVWFSAEDYGMHMRSNVPIVVPAADAVSVARLKARIRVTFPGRAVTETRKVEDVREGGEIRIGEAVITIVKAEKQGQQFNVRYRLGGKYQGRPVFQPLDNNGKPVQTQGGGSGGGGAEWHVNWHVRGEDVAQIRVLANVGHKTIEVPVEMKDIPLPKGD